MQLAALADKTPRVPRQTKTVFASDDQYYRTDEIAATANRGKSDEMCPEKGIHYIAESVQVIAPIGGYACSGLNPISFTRSKIEYQTSRQLPARQ